MDPLAMNINRYYSDRRGVAGPAEAPVGNGARQTPRPRTRSAQLQSLKSRRAFNAFSLPRVPFQRGTPWAERLLAPNRPFFFDSMCKRESKLCVKVYFLPGHFSKVCVFWGAFDSAKNHKRQRRKRQSVTAKREKSQTPKFV